MPDMTTARAHVLVAARRQDLRVWGFVFRVLAHRSAIVWVELFFGFVNSTGGHSKTFPQFVPGAEHAQRSEPIRLVYEKKLHHAFFFAGSWVTTVLVTPPDVPCPT